MFEVNTKKMGKAIGIGGIFFRFNDEKAMRRWYQEALGLRPNDYGVLFGFNAHEQPRRGFIQLGTFPADTDYFGRREQQAMINFRVEDLEGLEIHLRSLGTTICNTIETYEYGKFLHIEDPEGNRIELWEPQDKPFESEDFTDMR